MTGKYESLSDRIKRERMQGPITGLAGEDYALRWLDEHPNQVPGRTITVSELIAAVDETNHEDMNEYQKAHSLLIHLGYTIPFPKPTNEEKLEADLTDWYAKNADARPTLAEHLIERGWVKTSGGDDD